ncbi:MAG: FRG domain-containing protein [Bacilli bacterium]|nr:FRG domain-containing protein [Bacilli bacterium]
MYYRGQSKKFALNPDTGNDLTPSILRFGDSKLSLIREAAYYKKLFENLQEVLKVTEKLSAEALGKLQHYSFPTRLLDISSSENVAYYFACNNHFDEDGYLYHFDEGSDFLILKNELRKSVTRKIDTLMNSKELIEKKIDLQQYFMNKENQKQYIQTNSITTAVILDYKIVFGEEKVENIRYSRQEGSFILFGNEAIKKGNQVFLLDQINLKGLENLSPKVVKAENKLNILLDLAMNKGFHYAYFFPDNQEVLDLNAKYYQIYCLVNERDSFKLFRGLLEEKFQTEKGEISGFREFQNFLLDNLNELYNSAKENSNVFYFVFYELLRYYNYYRKQNKELEIGFDIIQELLKVA